MNTRHGMVDIETLGTKPGSVILSVGAVIFNPFESNINDGEEFNFYRNIELESCMNMGLKVDASTLEWWWNPKRDKPRQSLMKYCQLLPVVLMELSQFLRGTDSIWAHGAAFDPVLLESAFDACSLDYPWRFSRIKDTRTIYYASKYLGGVMDYRTGASTNNSHDAHYDAWVQARRVQNAFETQVSHPRVSKAFLISANNDGFSCSSSLPGYHLIQPSIQSRCASR